MKKDYMYLLLNKEILLGDSISEYEKELINMDRKKLDQPINKEIINEAIKSQKNDLKQISIPFTNKPILFFSKLDRYTARGLSNNIRMYNLYLEYTDKDTKTLEDVHRNIAKDLRAKDMYNKIYADQVKTLSTLKDIVDNIKRKGMK